MFEYPLNMALEELVFVAFDTETTGLDPAGHKMLELAAVKFRLDGHVLGQFSTLIDPGVPLADIPNSAGALAVNGITQEMLKGAPTDLQALAAFAWFIGSSPDVVLVAHNAGFDIGFVQAASDRVSAPFSFPVMCSMEMALAHLNVRGNRISLAKLAQDLLLPYEQDHRALGDSLIVKDAVLAMLRRYSPTTPLRSVRGVYLRQVVEVGDAE